MSDFVQLACNSNLQNSVKTCYFFFMIYDYLSVIWAWQVKIALGLFFKIFRFQASCAVSITVTRSKFFKRNFLENNPKT